MGKDDKKPLSSPPFRRPLPLPPSWDKKNFTLGDDVLFSRQDGMFVCGIVVDVDLDVHQCLIRFGDNTEDWKPFYSVRKLGDSADSVVAAPEPEPEPTPEPTPPSSSAPSEVEEEEEVVVQEDPLVQPTRKPTPEYVLQNRKKFLPYDFDALDWNAKFTRNAQGRYCYCGQSGQWFKKMVQCQQCLQWFHQECLRTSTPAMLLGDRFWEFSCALCTEKGKETLTRIDLDWVDALHLVLFSLTVSNSKKTHDLENHVLPFLKRNLKCLHGPSGLLKASRIEVQFITKLLIGNKARFMCGNESKRKGTFWALRKVAAPIPPSNKFIAYIESSAPVEPQNVERPITVPPPRKKVGDRGAGRILKPLPPNTARKRGRPVSIGATAAKRLRQSVSMETVSDDVANRTLDSLVPAPKDFDGVNNPFIGGEAAATPSSTTTTTTTAAVATPVSSKTGFFKSSRKYIPRCSSSFPSAGSSPSSSGVSSLEPSSKPPAPEKTPVFLTDLKCTLHSLFGEAKKPLAALSAAEVNGVKSRRLTLDGDIQYLMEWDAAAGPISPTVAAVSSSNNNSTSDDGKEAPISSNSSSEVIVEEKVEEVKKSKTGIIKNEEKELPSETKVISSAKPETADSCPSASVEPTSLKEVEDLAQPSSQSANVENNEPVENNSSAVTVTFPKSDTTPVKSVVVTSSAVTSNDVTCSKPTSNVVTSSKAASEVVTTKVVGTDSITSIGAKAVTSNGVKVVVSNGVASKAVTSNGVKAVMSNGVASKGVTSNSVKAVTSTGVAGNGVKTGNDVVKPNGIIRSKPMIIPLLKEADRARLKLKQLEDRTKEETKALTGEEKAKAAPTVGED